MNYDYLSEEQFDLMFDDEYQQWLEEKSAYEEALSQGR